MLLHIIALFELNHGRLEGGNAIGFERTSHEAWISIPKNATAGARGVAILIAELWSVGIVEVTVIVE